MKLLAFLNKPNDQAVLEAAVLHFTPSEMHIFVPLDNQRLDEETVGEWHVIRDNPAGASVKITGYHMNSSRTLDIVQMATRSTTKGDAVALPTTVRRAFMLAVPHLRAAGLKTVEIADGLNSAFGHLGHALAVRLTLNPLSLLGFARGLIRTPRCRTDLSFYPFYPLKSAFARSTIPAAPQRISRQKADALAGLLQGERPCLVGLPLLPAERIAERLSVSQYVATTKEKTIIVDGHRHDLPCYVCTEEVLAYMKPSFTMGYASNGVVMAKIMHVDRAAVIVTGVFRFKPTLLYETYFARTAASFGVRTVPVSSLSAAVTGQIAQCENLGGLADRAQNVNHKILDSRH